MTWAAALHPENAFYVNTAIGYRNEWLRELNARKPDRFPQIVITEIKQRRFPPTVPMQFELDTCSIETLASLLNDARRDQMLWQPLREGRTPARLPVCAECVVDPDGSKNVRFVI